MQAEFKTKTTRAASDADVSPVCNAISVLEYSESMRFVNNGPPHNFGANGQKNNCS